MDRDQRQETRDRCRLKITLSLFLSLCLLKEEEPVGGGFKSRRESERGEEERTRGIEMSTGDCSLKMDLGLLQSQERERVLEVLRRDKQLRTIEENRIR